jgi:GNAT superfamily N-acetyltransferase
MVDVTIRERAAGDLAGCIELLAAVHRHDSYPLNWPADPRLWLCPPDVLHAWIATADNAAIVGHIAVHGAASAELRASRPYASVSRLFVSPAFRRDLVATRLLQQARRWAADQGIDLILDVVDSQRSAAIALYERTGWQHSRTTTANWTDPDGSPVMLRHYTLRKDS